MRYWVGETGGGRGGEADSTSPPGAMWREAGSIPPGLIFQEEARNPSLKATPA